MAPLRATGAGGALGLAVALAALATHALAILAPGVPRVLDDTARVIAFVLLPGWAATRLLFSRRGLSRIETVVLIVGLGAVLAVLAALAASVTRVDRETAALTLAVLALVSLAPRRDEPEGADVAQAPAPQRSGASARAHGGTPAANARTRS